MQLSFRLHKLALFPVRTPRLQIKSDCSTIFQAHKTYCIAGKFGEDSFRAFGKRKFGKLIDRPIDY